MRRLWGWVLWAGWVGAQQSSLGVWTLQQLILPLEPSQRWQFFGVSQPRFVGNSWEAMVSAGLLGYRLHPQHTVFLGLVYGYFYRPLPRHQVRFLQRWHSTFLAEQQVLLRFTLEERWINGLFSEVGLRPFSRYRWPVGPLYFNLMQETIFLYHPVARPPFWEIGQNRLWVYVSFPRKSPWFLEVGYLNLAKPGRLPGHRLWVGVRWRIEGPKRQPPRAKAIQLVPQTRFKARFPNHPLNLLCRKSVPSPRR